MSKSKNIRNKQYQLVCEHCDKKFVGTRKVTRFCSPKCSMKSWYIRQNITYKKNHFKISAESQRKRKRKYKQQAIDILGGKCSKCGYKKCPAALDFHHISSKEKDYTVKELMHLSWQRIEKEIKKCILLCSNCHREHHYSDILENE